MVLETMAKGKQQHAMPSAPGKRISPAKQHSNSPEPRLRKRTVKASAATREQKSPPKPIATNRSPNLERSELVVVGIGASAGGLEACTELLEHLPEATSIAFVLVQHLDPLHESLLSELLGRRTKLTVREATEGEKVLPDRIYIIPPNKKMTLEKGVLRLAARTLYRGRYMPIDIFLRSLASDRGSHAVGVILSGANTDGALGIEAIKAEGGITFVQDPASAKHTEMPLAAIGTGCADFVLSPSSIAHELIRIDQHPYVRSSKGLDLNTESAGTVKQGAIPPASHELDISKKLSVQDLSRILLLLRSNVSVDFSQYKPATVQRRILRRMALLRIDNIDDYLRLLQANETELLALYQDILIKVTSFFRDPRVFDYLKQRIFPRLFKNRGANEPVRVWVPGCSSGEEAYSIAICLSEYLGRRRSDFPVQIFATDVSEAALDRAREGTYIENVALDVSAERLRRFFTRSGRFYEVNKPIREMVVFARQNLAKDPPFSRLDLLSCRNVLIYLGAGLQKKIFPIFHYALRHNGYLLLGNSETIGEFSDLFGQVDKKAGVYVRKNSLSLARFEATSTRSLSAESARPEPRIAFAGHPLGHPLRGGQTEENLGSPTFDFQREANRILLQRYTPPGVVVTSDLEVLQFHGQDHIYFEPAPGKASFSLLKLIKEGLAVHARSALASARKEGKVIRKRASFSDHDQVREVDLEVVPLKGGSSGDGHFLILFHPPTQAPSPTAGNQPPSTGSRPRQNTKETQKLKQELEITREHLQNIIEEQDAANEEIKSANEEILSSNEELQSTNEELETAKEELQSSNEELVTLNEELQNRNLELALANNDLSNLVNSINFAIVMLGNDGRIRRFTAMARPHFNLISSDVGRPFSDIKSNLQLPDLPATIKRVIETMEPLEMEVMDHDRHWFNLNIRPYKTSDSKIDGAVLSLIDIDTFKRSLEEMKRFRDLAEAIVATVREPLLVLDAELKVITASTAFFETFHMTSHQTSGKALSALGNGQWNSPRLDGLLAEVLKKGSRFENFVVEHDFRGIGNKKLLLNARRIDARGDRPSLALLALEDITERRQVEQEILAISEREQRRMAQDLHDGLGQQLTGIGFIVQSILNDFKQTADPQIIQSLDNLKIQINQAATLTRDLARGLRPMQLEAGQFKTAMQALANNVENLSKVVCTFHCDDPYRPPNQNDEAPTHLYRITQEAVNNALRHGKAGRIAISYGYDAQARRLKLSISDDGSGIKRLPHPGIVNKGMGLQIMRYRAESLGGKLTVEQSTNGGTIVTVSVPVRREPE